MPSLIDRIVEFVKIETSGLVQSPDTGNNVDIVFNVEGIPGIDDDSLPEDNEGEVYGALGILSRPLPANDTDNAEAICIRTVDGIIPIAAKDSRLSMPGNAPNEGTVALVGYGKGFHSLMPSGGNPANGTIHTLYCGYDFDADGLAQKAHSITLDPTAGNESIQIIHAEGHSIFLQNDGSVQLQSPNGQSFIKIEDGKITLQSDQVVFNGTVFIGSPLLGVPLLPGAASAPCPRLFLSPSP